MKKFVLFLALLPSAVQAQQRPTDAMLNGRIDSLLASQKAGAVECADRTGQLYDALEKAGAEIRKLKAELAKAPKN